MRYVKWLMAGFAACLLLALWLLPKPLWVPDMTRAPGAVVTGIEEFARAEMTSSSAEAAMGSKEGAVVNAEEMAVPVAYGAAADPEVRAALADRWRQRSRTAREQAYELAAAGGLPIRGQTSAGQTFELMRITASGLPLYNVTRTTAGGNAPRNFHAGISGNAEAIRSRPPFMMRTGEGMLLGVWDGGHALTNHVEFLNADDSSRVHLMDVDGEENFNDHASHVVGTMVAAGLNPRAKGMAPQALLWSYDWDEDVAEWIEAATATALPSTTNIVISNHSYGPSPGWGAQENAEGESIVVWTGFESHGESYLFGKYTEECLNFDEAIYAAPYTLAFFAAGNERTSSPEKFGLEEGDAFFVTNLDDYDLESEEPPELLERIYDPDNALPDNDFKGGMNTIAGVSIAKNVMAVGAVLPGYELTTRNPSRALMSNFSGWGPTDDGRIKPDIVSDGVQLLSVDVEDAEGYQFMTGTSMASPAAAGTAALLQDLYRSWFDEYMSAALLKALIIHTATDLGRPGPDYTYGWGLLDGQAAAVVIHEHFLTPDRQALTEGVLENNQTNEYAVVWDGVSPLSATLAWTDPPPSPELIDDIYAELNATDRMLIHDLDLRIIGPDNTVYEPWILDPAEPFDDATRGDNVLDNVERVDAMPTVAGEYRIVITHKDELTASQPYGLVVTGQRMTDGPRLRVFVERDGMESRIGQGDILYMGQTVDLAPSVVTGRVANVGGAPLHLYGTQGPMVLRGDAAIDVSQQPAAQLMPGAQSVFEMTYDPDAFGRVSARVEMIHNEVYQSPFFFDVLATSRESMAGLPITDVTELVLTQHVARAGIVADVNVTLGMSGMGFEALLVELVSPSGVTNMVFVFENVEAPDFENVTFAVRGASPPDEGIVSGAEYLFLDLEVRGEYEDAGDWILIIRNHPDIIPDLFSLYQFELAIDWLAPQLILPSGAVFRESLDDDGSMQNAIQIAVIGDEFTEDADQYVQVYNVPQGLTAAVELTEGILEIALSGQAIHHNRFNSTANLIVTLEDGAFEGDDASAIRGLPLHGLMIDFIGDDGNLYVTTAPVAVPVAWLAGHGIMSSLHAAVWLDQNASTYPTWQHFIMDTDPTEAGSELQFGGAARIADGVELQWWASSNRLYQVRGSTNLAEGLSVTIADPWQPDQSGWQTFTDTNMSSQILIYGVEVLLP